MVKKQLVFTASIREYLLGKVRQAISEFDTEEGIEKLLQKQFSFIDADEDKKFVKELLRFVNKKEISPIAHRNINFCSPQEFPQAGGIVRYSFSFGGKSAVFIDIINDFILNVSRKLCGEKDISVKLKREWKKFETDFFDDEIEITFTAPLAKFYYQAGGIIEDLIPRKDIVTRYLHPDIKDERSYIYNLKKSFDSAFRPVCKDEFSTCPIVVEYKIKGDKSRKIASYFEQAGDMFEKIVFLIRLICGGSVHFGFIKAYFLGNYAKTDLIQSYPSNHLYANNFESTIIRNGPYETWIKRAWKGIDSRDISEWQFANQKLRDSYSRISSNDEQYFYDSSYKMSRELERLVDLIQALEFTLGDYGYHIAEYTAKLVSRGDEEREKRIKKETQSLYILRDKYLHGKPHGKDSVESSFRSKFQGKIELLVESINRLEYYSKQVLIVSILNSNLKDGISAYHESLGRPILQVIRKPANPINFPKFNTIYY